MSDNRDDDITEALTSTFSSLASSGSAQGTILIADDDMPTRLLLRTVLEGNRFSVIEAVNGEHAYESALKQPPDLVLIDWLMPVMDGRAATELFKANPLTRRIPIIMLTSRAESEDKIEALRAGVQDFLTKPFSPGELLARIEQHLRWRALLTGEDTRPGNHSGEEVEPQNALPSNHDLWRKALEACRSDKLAEALSLFLAEAEHCDEEGSYVRAAAAYRCAALVAAQMQDRELPSRLLRLAGKMYLCQAEATSDERSTQNAHLSAARCFLLTGNLSLAKTASTLHAHAGTASGA